MFSINVASITSPGRLSRRMAVGIALGLALAGLTLTISPARAQAEGCPSAPLSQPFSKFNDTNWYELVPNGDFEGSTAGWTLSGKAALASGSESYAVTGKLGKSSLELPAGASATSPFMCVDKSYRTMRFFARSEGGSSSVSVQVLYKTPNGPYVGNVGTVSPSSSWAPTEKLPTLAAPASAESNGTAQVSIRVTAKSGLSRVDDVYLDPRMH
jgi:hypothetical protein